MQLHPAPDTASAQIRIVGMGASAGGLAALEQFFHHVPIVSGLAYVVVQHLDPSHKTQLAELLQRSTTLKVQEAHDWIIIQPNCVYVIPPGKQLRLSGTQLRVETYLESHGLRLPINEFFLSLAHEQGMRSIAVVLSGMGSDGTVGMQSVHMAGGLLVVQDPDTAQFDSMPKSAIATGNVAIVGQPQDLPTLIFNYLAKDTHPLASAPMNMLVLPPPALDPLTRIISVLRNRRRHDFSLYKPATLHRRIERRMLVHSINDMQEYADFLQRNPQEVDLLYEELLIGVTRFFRDALLWQQFGDVTLPDLIRSRPAQQRLRAWVIGCSTGEEAYSLAMAFTDVLRHYPNLNGYTLQVFASDVSHDAITKARSGVYPVNIKESLSPERLTQYFRHRDGRYEIKQSIRDMVLFAQHDVILDPPFTKLDLVFCRNLMIYFDSLLQQRLLPLLHYSLLPGGYLVLGSSESIGRFDSLFAGIEPKQRIYRRREEGLRPTREFLVTSFPPLSSDKQLTGSSLISMPSDLESIQKAADHLLLQTYAPSAVVVNKSGDVIYISGRTGDYLEPAAGQTNWNFHAMVRESLRARLTSALNQAFTNGESAELRHLRVPRAGGSFGVDVTMQFIQEPHALHGMVLVVFRDKGRIARAKRREGNPSFLESTQTAELLDARNQIDALQDQMRSSKEDLQSANEELQSTNEELQSTNEELTTSKEEMQSMNEELQTVNTEMENKLDDLYLAQNDMKNLLNSTEIAMLFLDQSLNVRRFTERASKIINIRDVDVGRPLSDLTTSLQYSELHNDAMGTLRTLKFSEKQAMTTLGKWFSIRIMPYRRQDNLIDGVVITFVDITDTKLLESSLRAESRS